jgi:hypothetical protein
MRNSKQFVLVEDGFEDLQSHTDDWNLPTSCDLGLKSSEAGEIYLAQNNGSRHIQSRLNFDEDMQSNELFRSQVSFLDLSEDSDDSEWASGSPRISIPSGNKRQCRIWDEIVPNEFLEEVGPLEKDGRWSPGELFTTFPRHIGSTGIIALVSMSNQQVSGAAGPTLSTISTLS